MSGKGRARRVLSCASRNWSKQPSRDRLCVGQAATANQRAAAEWTKLMGQHYQAVQVPSECCLAGRNGSPSSTRVWGREKAPVPPNNKEQKTTREKIESVLGPLLQPARLPYQAGSTRPRDYPGCGHLRAASNGARRAHSSGSKASNK